MTEACETESGTFSEEIQLPVVREEIEKFSVAIKSLLGTNPEFKQASSELLTDHLLIMRQTKVDPETDKTLTKYVSVNSLVGAEPVVKQVFLTLDPLLNTFTFTKKWDMSVTVNE